MFLAARGKIEREANTWALLQGKIEREANTWSRGRMETEGESDVR